MSHPRQDGRFDRIIIETGAAGDPLTGRITGILGHLPVERVDDVGALLESSPERGRSILLRRHRGGFVKDFPTGEGVPPCGEKYILTMLSCPFSCSYCYLQSYLEDERIVLHTNTERMIEETAAAAAAGPVRLTTGEMGDSLALDRITGYTAMILPALRGTGSVLEARTKSARIDHLLETIPEEDLENLVITWTLSPPEAIEREELLTAGLGERLEAVSRAAREGIRIGLRLDPVVPFYYGAEKYRPLIEKFAAAAGAGPVYRVELGVLRFPPGLWERIREKRPGSNLLKGEYFRDRGGKIRLYRPDRVRIYRELASSVREVLPGARIELSMEDRSVWEDSGLTWE